MNGRRHLLEVTVSRHLRMFCNRAERMGISGFSAEFTGRSTWRSFLKPISTVALNATTSGDFRPMSIARPQGRNIEAQVKN